MNPTYIIWLTLFCAVLYMMAVDKNVSVFIDLFIKSVILQLKNYYFKVRFHPFLFMNPISQWLMMRKYRKMAKEMLKSLQTETNETDS